jgi:zinc protease
MNRFRIFTLLLLILNFAGIAQVKLDRKADIPSDPLVRMGKLTNGMRYYVRKNNKPEHRAELRLVVNAGSMEEQDDQQGLAHFCEHMAFNGTSNFKKSALIDYLESVGTKFGADLNAYTSFDETVYMLKLPTDKKEILSKGFQILEDWSHNVSYETEEIDKERGVVTEEWRLGQGADERMRNVYFPVLFKNSRYENRIPIGKPEILKTCKYETLKQFYTDWYRPELMAVIAVGDFDPLQIEKLIKEKFSAIPAGKTSKKLEKYPVPDNKELLIAKATDKEAEYTALQIYYKHDLSPAHTIDDYRKNLIVSLFSQMLNNRYEELRQKPNTPFSYMGSNYGNLVRSKDAFSTFALLSSDKNTEAGLREILEENERARRYGFTAGELERQKKEMLKDAEVAFQEKDKTESGRIIREYVQNFLTALPVPGIEFKYEAAKTFLDGISLNEVNAVSQKLITNGENCVIVITAPDKKEVILPSDEVIRAIFNNTLQEQLKPYQDKVLAGPLMISQPIPGRIESEKKIPELGITTWTLSNGSLVYLKPTNFKNDEILFSAQSNGGSSLFSDPDQLTASFGSYAIGQSGIGRFDNISLQKYLSGKQANLYPYVTELQENMRGSCSVKDQETLLQMIHLYFTAPRKDSLPFNSTVQQQAGFLENAHASPESVFDDTIQVVMANHHPRYLPVTSQMIKAVKLDKAFTAYQELFTNANGFMFCFVGNFDPAKLKPLVEKYLASLPGIGKPGLWKDTGKRYPKGVVNKTVKKGSEPKSQVTMHFTGDFKYTEKNKNNLNALTKLLNIRLREVLREDMGGTYGVRIFAATEQYPKQTYDITISFGCAPDRVDTLRKAALLEIEKVKKEGCEDKNLVKIKETFRRDREDKLKDNQFWLASITDMYRNKEDLVELNEYNAFVEALNGAMFKELASQYFDMNNYATFILLPEK